jgi:hypothetical protein
MLRGRQSSESQCPVYAYFWLLLGVIMLAGLFTWSVSWTSASAQKSPQPINPEDAYEARRTIYLTYESASESEIETIKSVAKELLPWEGHIWDAGEGSVRVECPKGKVPEFTQRLRTDGVSCRANTEEGTVPVSTYGL